MEKPYDLQLRATCDHLRKRLIPMNVSENPEITTPCMVWDGIPDPRTRAGRKRPDGSPASVFVLMKEDQLGRRLGQGEVGCHECDIPGCCEPDHIRVDDQGGNITEMYARGRGGHQKILPQRGDEIRRRFRELRAQGMGIYDAQKEIAPAYGVAPGALRTYISDGESYCDGTPVRRRPLPTRPTEDKLEDFRRQRDAGASLESLADGRSFSAYSLKRWLKQGLPKSETPEEKLDRLTEPGPCGGRWAKKLQKGNDLPRQRIKVFGEFMVLHRAALALRLGRPIRRGYIACHGRLGPGQDKIEGCGPACIDHAYEGTLGDNARDTRRDGNCGGPNHQKLDDAKAREIFQGFLVGRDVDTLAAENGVHRVGIYSVASGRSWTSATEDIRSGPVEGERFDGEEYRTMAYMHLVDGRGALEVTREFSAGRYLVATVCNGQVAAWAVEGPPDWDIPE